MADTEMNNLFKVAKSRGIKPIDVLEALENNGRQIYLSIKEELLGLMVFEGIEENADPSTYSVKKNIYPVTPGSRVELWEALDRGEEQADLNIRISWESSPNKIKDHFIVRVSTDFPSMLVIDYQDYCFLPPLSSIGIKISSSDKTSPAKFFSDEFFHQLVLRTMRKDGKDWNTVKRNLRNNTLDGEQISIAEVSNFEGEMRNQIQFKKEGAIEPYKVMESTFKKNLTAYRKHLRELPLPGNNR